MSSDTSAPGHSCRDRQTDRQTDRRGPSSVMVSLLHSYGEWFIFIGNIIVCGKSFGSAFAQNTAKSPSCSMVALYRWPKINTLLPLRMSSIMQMQCNWIHPYRSHSIGYVYSLLLYVNTQTKELSTYQKWAELTLHVLTCTASTLGRPSPPYFVNNK